MLTLTGKILAVIPGESTNRTTGEVSKNFTVEILHSSRGRSVVESVKIDPEVGPQWTKLVGADMSVEVRTYAMKTADGFNSGLTLADKKALPQVHQPMRQAA